MKKIIALTLLLLLSCGTIHAETCKIVYETAYAVMKLRQNNIPITDVMNALSKTGEPVTEDDKTARKVISKIVLEAYKTPNMITEEYKEQASIDFGNKYYIICTESWK